MDVLQVSYLLGGRGEVRSFHFPHPSLLVPLFVIQRSRYFVGAFVIVQQFVQQVVMFSILLLRTVLKMPRFSPRAHHVFFRVSAFLTLVLSCFNFVRI